MRIRLIAGGALAIALLLSLATAALGHAQLVSSDPAAGATIKTPYTLTATYDEELTPDGSSIVLQDSTGKTVASGTVSSTDDKVMTIDVPQLPDGVYQVAWTAVTADDNGVTRAVYQFTVQADFNPTGTPGATATAPVFVGTPTPAASATPGQNTGGGSDLLLPLAAVIVIVVAIAGFLLYRNRRPE